MAPDLQRFIDAQRTAYDDAVGELRRGRKTGHWIWFVFPQMAGLGSSSMSRHYAITSLDEARAYLADPVLGARLRECAWLVLAAAEGGRSGDADRSPEAGRSAAAIFGDLDAMKVRSSMTLFHRAAPEESVFVEVLARCYGGVGDPRTDELLRDL